MKIKSLPLALLSLLLFSCVSNVEDLTDDVVPEPDEVSYASDIQPIFNSQCTSCHGNNGNISFTTYANTTSGTGNFYGANLIISGDADASGLVDKIEPNPESGSRMPQGGSLTATEIATIKAWINQGALNN